MSERQQDLTSQQAISLAVQHHTAGALEKAETIYQRVLQDEPDHPVALHLLGMIAHQVGKNELATQLISKALSSDPNYGEALCNLGLVLQEVGKLHDAVSNYQKALHLKPDYPEAHNNLGTALHKLGSLEKAADHYRKAINIRADYAEAFNNLGNTLKELGKLEEAANSYKDAIAIRPTFAAAQSNYGVLLLTLGSNQEAFSHLRKGFELVRGNNPAIPRHESFQFITKIKMRHDIEQFQYLARLGIKKDSFGNLAQTYLKLDEEIQWPQNSSEVVPLTNNQRDLIGDSYNRILHILHTPEVSGPALNQNLDTKSITQNYTDNVPGITYFDNFLNHPPLEALRRFLLESTIWYYYKYPGGYLGAMLIDGMACPLLFQIANELRRTFPDILQDYPLKQLWAYKYDRGHTGINLHADVAAINVNFWITPNSANLNPANGGLIVHKQQAPLDWDFSIYNPGTNEGHNAIRSFLTNHNSGKMVIPYAENRVVLFNSNLFHETDSFEFRSGYENRRINITMLFGDRQYV